ncbi:MAG TPA: hypothetical protein VFL92_02785 [Sphingomonas sp.]|nr:hypothetical protein [Sphingomonas sp.]
MRVFACLLAVAALSGVAACHKRSTADRVEHYYQRKAAEMDAIAEKQPTEAARNIYKARADALRREGEEREKGLRAANAQGRAPRLSNIEKSLNVSTGGAQ